MKIRIYATPAVKGLRVKGSSGWCVGRTDRAEVEARGDAQFSFSGVSQAFNHCHPQQQGQAKVTGRFTSDRGRVSLTIYVLFTVHLTGHCIIVDPGGDLNSNWGKQPLFILSGDTPPSEWRCTMRLLKTWRPHSRGLGARGRIVNLV